MREIVLSLAVFACLVAASLGCLFTYERLHDKYRHDNTANVVRLIANLFVVTTSLVLGLMINSAKNTFESIDHNVHSFGTELILFDRALRQYGPETTEVREILLSYLNRTLGGGAAATGEWGKRDAGARRLFDQAEEGLLNIAPPDERHAAILADAIQHLNKVIEMRWVLVEQSEGVIPMPMVVMLSTWLVLIFGSFGYRAPVNGVIIASLILSAALMASAIYLVLDMDVPFEGLIQISPAPLERALEEIRQ